MANASTALEKQYSNFLDAVEHVGNMPMDPALRKQFLADLFNVYFKNEAPNASAK